MPTMHSNLVLHLPNEILASIIDELALDNDNDKDKILLAALASCRLASHVLCSLATPLLFSSILLTDVSGDGRHGGTFFVERATKLNDILATRNIAASIRSFTLRTFCYGTLEDSSNGAIMSAILPRLPQIRRFSLKATHITSFHLLPMDFAAAIEALCRSPNLTTLYLDGIANFPFTTIRTSPNLRCLRLEGSPGRGLLFDNSNSMHEMDSHLLQLESLTIDALIMYSLCSGISEDVSIAKCFSRMKNLHLKHLSYDAYCLSRGWDIMLLALQTLKKFELTVYDTFVPGRSENMLASVPFDLGRFPALRHFKIEQQTHYLYNEGLLRFLARLLSVSSPPSGIEVLEIRISWFDVRDGDGKDLFSSNAGWSTLDELFTSQRFFSLRNVVLWLELRMAAWPLPPHIGELERNLTLPHVNDLFPSFRASSTQRTLEIHLKVDV